MADIEISEIPGLEQADAELQRMMAEDARGTGKEAIDEKAAAAAAQAEKSASEGQRAAQGENEKPQGQPGSKSETPAGAEKPAAESNKGPEKSKEPEKLLSRFAKNEQRKALTWQEINAEKEALKAERETIQREREQWETQRQESAKEYSVEDYTAAAGEFEKAATALEAKGDFDGAAEQRAMAKMARQQAEAIKKDPAAHSRAAKQKAATERSNAERKEWATKAAIDFPELAKDNSGLQVRVAQLLKEEPALKSHSKGMYWAARMAAAEAASAGVAGKDAELTRLKSRVAELEQLTSPGGGGSAAALPGEKSFEQMSPDEQMAELTRQAMEVGSLSR